MNEINKDRLSSISFLAFAFLILACSLLITHNMIPIADEELHCQQIMDIVTGRDYFPDHCPYLPGYHWTMAALLILAQNSLGVTLRYFATLISFLCVACFFFLARKIDKDASVRKSLLFIFFPLFFPFFSLIYTDIYSMLLIFLVLLLALDRRLWLSGIVGILSLIIRQNNIVWLALIALIAYAENFSPQHRWHDIQIWFSKFFFFLLAAGLTVAFVIWNKGFVLGDRSHHEFTLSFNNLFFLLVLFFFLFLPHNLSNLYKIKQFLRKHKLMWLLLAEIFFVFILFFKAEHPYNLFGRFLHNWILWGMAGPFLNQCLYFILIAYSILSLCVTPLKKKSFYLLYPFTILFLLPNAVTEIRYCFIPYALFILFKEPDSERITLFTIATYLVPTAAILSLLLDAVYFP